MEFINYEREYAKDFKKYATQQDADALSREFSVTFLETVRNEQDNSFIDASFGRTIHNLRTNGAIIIGIGVAPWRHREGDLAVVFEDVNHEKFWCHISNSVLNWWTEQANYGRTEI